MFWVVITWIWSALFHMFHHKSDIIHWRETKTTSIISSGCPDAIKWPTNEWEILWSNIFGATNCNKIYRILTIFAPFESRRSHLSTNLNFINSVGIWRGQWKRIVRAPNSILNFRNWLRYGDIYAAARKGPRIRTRRSQNPWSFFHVTAQLWRYFSTFSSFRNVLTGTGRPN